MPYSVISGTGSYLPKKKLTNNDLASQLDTTDAWIVERTGIQSRSIAESQESTAFLATNAARLAIESAGVDKNDIDMIIVATCSPDNFFPSVGSEVQYRLGLSRSIPAFDISVACSGFIYALDIADKYVTQGIARHILVIGAEQMSKTVNWEDRSTCILFGDGAGAVMLSHSTTKKGIISSVLHAKYDDARLLQLRNTHVQPATYPFVEMKGNELFRVAVTLMGDVVDELLNKAEMDVDELDWLIPHQANLRIIQAIAKKLKFPLSKIIVTLQSQGNTSAASIPIAIDTAIKNDQLKKDNRFIIESFGAGLAWGAMLISL